ncbi:MAG: ATP-binding protein [Clostridiales bacterium]|nr:MAG: ATP-binding protein [Clostridiales bacterium]
MSKNSIDAGAKSVKIEVFSGGKSKIRVTDDGAGIAKDDLLTAFLPHATSKIHKKTTFFSIQTLGFSRRSACKHRGGFDGQRDFKKTDADDAAYGAELRGGKVEKHV